MENMKSENFVFALIPSLKFVLDKACTSMKKYVEALN
jgi:hypothetical protein